MNNNEKKQGKKAKKSKKAIVFKIIKNTIKTFVIIFLVISIIGISIGTLFAKEVIDNIPKSDGDNFFLKEQSIIYDKHGNVISTLGTNRKNLEYDDIPEIFVQSLIAVEDARFFAHDGIDKPRFMATSIKSVANVLRGGAADDAGGASTLTMQVSKNAYTRVDNKLETTREQIERKIQDLYVAKFIIEETYTKEEILAYYSNVLYLGAPPFLYISYGISSMPAAIQFFFFFSDIPPLPLFWFYHSTHQHPFSPGSHIHVLPQRLHPLLQYLPSNF